MRLHPPPLIQPHMTFPKYPMLLIEAVVHRKLQVSDHLMLRRRFIPNHGSVFGWMMGEIGIYLHPELVFRGLVIQVLKKPIGKRAIRIK